MWKWIALNRGLGYNIVSIFRVILAIIIIIIIYNDKCYFLFFFFSFSSSVIGNAIYSWKCQEMLLLLLLWF